jgi:hypothetical protein
MIDPRRSRPMRVTVALCAALVATSGLRARAADSKPEETAKVRVTTFLVKRPGVDVAALPRVMRALEDGLKRNERLEMKDLDSRLADFAQEVPQAQIDEGRQLLEDGRKLMIALELPQSIKKLQQSIDVLGKVLPHIKKLELADAMMALAVAQWMHGDKREGKATFVRLLVWRSDYKFDTERYAPSLLQPFEEARREVEKTRRGSLEITTDPAGAQAYVDGKYVGITPASAEGLVSGEHWVTVKKEGYRKAVMPGVVSPRAPVAVNVTLERSGKYLLVEQALSAVEKKIGSPTLDSSCDDLKEVLFIDHAVFVRAAPIVSPGMIDLEVFLYDLRLHRRLSSVARKIAIADIETQLQNLAGTLYANVKYDAELEAPADAPPPKQVVRRKFYKTWWFWTVIGVVAAGAAVTTGVLVARNRPVNCPRGQCYDPEY